MRGITRIGAMEMLAVAVALLAVACSPAKQETDNKTNSALVGTYKLHKGRSTGTASSTERPQIGAGRHGDSNHCG